MSTPENITPFPSGISKDLKEKLRDAAEEILERKKTTYVTQEQVERLCNLVMEATK